jgi:hypothetical protein
MDRRNDAKPKHMSVSDANSTDGDASVVATGPDHAAGRQSTSNTVGYGRPPVHTRFKPGQSGNPDGRRKISADVSLALRIALDEQVPITEGKTRRNVSKAKAFLVLLVHRALKGDMKALASLVKIGVKTGSIRPAPVVPKGGVLIMPPSFWKLSSWEEKSHEMDKEAARRDCLLARGLPYSKHAGPPMAPSMNLRSQRNE